MKTARDIQLALMLRGFPSEINPAQPGCDRDITVRLQADTSVSIQLLEAHDYGFMQACVVALKDGPVTSAVKFWPERSNVLELMVDLIEALRETERKVA